MNGKSAIEFKRSTTSASEDLLVTNRRQSCLFLASVKLTSAANRF